MRQPLYHYTDAGALRGILDSDEFWFTDIYHLNDDREFKYGTDLALEVLREHPLRSDKVIEFLHGALADTVENHLHKLFSVYTASFTGLIDDEGQWDEYGAKGHGCAIALAPSVFRRTDMDDPSNVNTYPMIVGPMIYDRAVSKQRISESVDYGLKMIHGLKDVLGRSGPDHGLPFVREFSSLLSLDILIEAFAAKDARWMREKEVRLTIAAMAGKIEPSVRLRGGVSIPYVRQKMGLRNGGIAKIIMGAAVSAETEAELRELLIAHGLAPSLLCRSTVVVGDKCRPTGAADT